MKIMGSVIKLGNNINTDLIISGRYKFSITDMNALERLSRYLAQNTANLISYDNITRTLGITFPTLKKYLNAMEKSYLIMRVYPYFTNKLKEIVKQPKLYFV